MKQRLINICLFLLFMFEIKGQDSLSALIKERDEVKQKLSTIISEFETTKRNLENTIEQKNGLLKEKENEINNKEEYLNQIKVLLKEKQTIIDDKVATIEEKEKKILEKDNEIKNLDNKVKAKEEIIEAKNQSVTKSEETIIQLKKNIDNKEDLIRAKEETLKVKTEKIEDLQENINGQKKELESLRNNRKWLRVVQGIGFYGFRTPNYELAPKSSLDPTTLVINNKNSGRIEGDLYTGFSIMMIDFNKKDLEQRMSCGPFIAFGGRDLFRNFYLGWDFKLYMIHATLGFNFHEFEVLKSGFNLGDVVKPGQSLPTTNQWKTFIPFFGISLDTEFIVNALGSSKK